MNFVLERIENKSQPHPTPRRVTFQPYEEDLWNSGDMTEIRSVISARVPREFLHFAEMLPRRTYRRQDLDLVL
jgi:hypothetical protein